MTKEDVINANTKIHVLLKQLSQEQSSQQQQKSMPGSMVLPSAESAPEELAIHPGGSGETSGDVIMQSIVCVEYVFLFALLILEK